MYIEFRKLEKFRNYTVFQQKQPYGASVLRGRQLEIIIVPYVEIQCTYMKATSQLVQVIKTFYDLSGTRITY